jgi:transglutaminase-like putative cysteine protease
LALDPTVPSYRLKLADLQLQAGQSAAALQTLRAAHAVRPQNADTETALADALAEHGGTKEAVALYRDAVRLDPSAVTLRDKLAVMTGAKPVLDLAPETPEAPLLAASASAAAPGASAVMLLDEGRTVVYPDFATLTRYHQIIKLLDQSAVDRYSEYPLARMTSTSEATVESARVLKADGKIQDVTEDAGSSSVSFPSLSPGDVLDISYRVEDYHRGGLAHQFWSSWTFSETGGPSRLSRYVLITVPGLALSMQNHGAIPPPSVHDIGGWRVREWRLADIPARPSEIMAAGPLDSGMWLDASTLTSWSQVVDWYEGLSAPRCVPDAVVRAKAAELTKTAKTDTEKIQALQAYVARDVEYQSSPFRLSAYVPTEGKEVIRERYGDCKDKAALLTALLAAVGIKSDMVLLSPRRYGLTPYLPSPRFSHAIARVQTAQGPLFVDATAADLEFGNLPVDDQQVPALVIAPATTALSETPLLPLDTAASEAAYAETLNADGSLHGTLDWTLAGRLAWQMRLALRQVPEAKHEEMMHSLASFLLKSAVCDTDSLDHAADPNLPLLFHFASHTDHYGTPAGSFLLLPLPWSTEAEESSVAALLSEPARTGDLEAASSRARTRAVAHIRLPAGYAPQELPADVHQETPFGSFQTHFEFKAGLLTATYAEDLTAMRVPARDVPQYAAFLKAINDETARQIVLKKP